MTRREMRTKIALGVFAVVLLAIIIGTLTQWPELIAIYPQLTAALTIVNMILRFMTYQAIGDGDNEE
jgi:hypothetical protein